MPPLQQLGDWTTVLCTTERLIGAESHTIIDWFRSSHAESCDPKFFGRHGYAMFTMRDGFVLMAGCKYDLGGQQTHRIATQSSVAHHNRCGHSPWWRYKNDPSDFEEREYETECGCSKAHLRQDTPRQYATEFEENFLPFIQDSPDDLQASLLKRLQDELSVSQKDCTKLRKGAQNLLETIAKQNRLEVMLEMHLARLQEMVEGLRRENEELQGQQARQTSNPADIPRENQQPQEQKARRTLKTADAPFEYSESEDLFEQLYRHYVVRGRA